MTSIFRHEETPARITLYILPPSGKDFRLACSAANVLGRLEIERYHIRIGIDLYRGTPVWFRHFIKVDNQEFPMGEDIKSLTKKNDDLEKRLKLAEAKIKALADNMTNSKDIKNYMLVVNREATDRKKGMDRIEELFRKKAEAQAKEWEKEMEKNTKDSVRKTEFLIIDARLKAVEAMVRTLSK
ncbi:MAG: hypothetical protein ACI8Q6_001691 [Granulosicoccus sp.]